MRVSAVVQECKQALNAGTEEAGGRWAKSGVTEMDGGAAGKKCKREENNRSIEENLRQWECETNPILRPFKAISEVCFDMWEAEGPVKQEGNQSVWKVCPH